MKDRRALAGRSPSRSRPLPSEAAVVTKAALRAAALLDLSNKVLARVVGLSEASVSRMGAGAYLLAPGDKAYELAVLFIRLYRDLDGLVDGDEAVARAWLRSPNTALGDTPIALIQTVTGLVSTLAYLDARRALA
jgi:uncharacterized protein (DUF2384 family)